MLQVEHVRVSLILVFPKEKIKLRDILRTDSRGFWAKHTCTLKKGRELAVWKPEAMPLLGLGLTFIMVFSPSQHLMSFT